MNKNLGCGAMVSHNIYLFLGMHYLFFQEVISEDLRATLNAFLYRTGEQSNR